MSTASIRSDWVQSALQQNSGNFLITKTKSYFGFFRKTTMIDFSPTAENVLLNRCSLEEWRKRWGHNGLLVEGVNYDSDNQEKISKILQSCLLENSKKIRKEFRYDQKLGLTKESFIDWEELKATHIIQNHPGGYLYNIKISSDHTAIELVSDNKDAYSVGLYGFPTPPFKTMRGRLFSPDPIEAEGADLKTFSFAIEAGKFNKIKQFIEERNQKDEKFFNAGSYNCSDFAADILINIVLKDSKIEFNHKKPGTVGFARYLNSRYKIGEKMLPLSQRVHRVIGPVSTLANKVSCVVKPVIGKINCPDKLKPALGLSKRVLNHVKGFSIELCDLFLWAISGAWMNNTNLNDEQVSENFNYEKCDFKKKYPYRGYFDPIFNRFGVKNVGQRLLMTSSVELKEVLPDIQGKWAQLDQGVTPVIEIPA
jgi:hypothetical protein